MSNRRTAATPPTPLRAVAVGVAFVLGVAAACATSTFTCSDDAACRDGDTQGFCEAEGFCSFPDDACASGRRYAERSDDTFAGKCVAADADTGGSSTNDGLPGVDAYGPCTMASDCEVAGSACVSNGTDRMCAPPCTDARSPSTECPATIDGDTAHVGCLFTDTAMTTTRCFVVCDGETSCPDGMSCAEPVCTWMTP